MLGDLNYRISLPEETTRLLVEKKDWDSLLENDQVGRKSHHQFFFLRKSLNKLISNLIVSNWNEANDGANEWQQFKRVA